MSERDIVAEWLKIAYDDYDSAKYLFDNKHPNPIEIICYHCQQTIEKSLKAFLCDKGVEIPKTHDTGLLCHLCTEFDIDFKAFQVVCDDVAIYATQTRYPIRIEIDKADAKSALQHALEIYAFVSNKLEGMATA